MYLQLCTYFCSPLYSIYCFKWLNEIINFLKMKKLEPRNIYLFIKGQTSTEKGLIWIQIFCVLDPMLLTVVLHNLPKVSRKHVMQTKANTRSSYLYIIV